MSGYWEPDEVTGGPQVMVYHSGFGTPGTIENRGSLCHSSTTANLSGPTNPTNFSDLKTETDTDLIFSITEHKSPAPLSYPKDNIGISYQTFINELIEETRAGVSDLSTSSGNNLVNSHKSRSSSTSYWVPSTPCPLRHNSNRTKSTKKFHSHFHNIEVHNKTRANNKGKTVITPQSEGEKYIHELRNGEGLTHHVWCPNEKALAFSIYFGSFKFTEQDATLLFNTIFKPLNLGRRAIRATASSLHLYGEKAFPEEFDLINSFPFADLIQNTALELSLIFTPREPDARGVGRAASSKNSHIKRAYRARIQKQKLATSQINANHLKPFEQRLSLPSGRAIVSMDSLDYQFVDNCRETVVPSSRAPHLAFRVWDKDSFTTYQPGIGFESKLCRLFNDKSNVVPLVPSAEFIPVFGLGQLSLKSGINAFVSVSVSLLAVLVMAANKSADAQIALIDLDHPALQKYYAKDIVKGLKSTNEMTWTRYSASTEWLVWTHIPESAIITVVSVKALLHLALQKTSIRQILSPQLFNPPSSCSIPKAARQLRECNHVLDATTASSLAELAAFFGLGSSASPAHLSDFVATIIDGWSLRNAAGTNTEALARIFTKSLCPRDREQEQEMMQAFITGVRQGTETFKFYNRRSL